MRANPDVSEEHMYMSKSVRMMALAAFEVEFEDRDDLDVRNLMQYSTRKNRTAPFSEMLQFY